MTLDSPPLALQNVFLMVLRLQPLRHIALGVWDSPISNEWNINPDVLRHIALGVWDSPISNEWNINPDVLRVCSLSRMENSLRD